MQQNYAYKGENQMRNYLLFDVKIMTDKNSLFNLTENLC